MANQAEQRDFSNYHLGDNVYELADGMVPEMAAGFNLEIGNNPEEATLQNLVGQIGPAKWLQDNIEQVQAALGNSGSATEIAANWTEKSGVLVPVRRSFVSPEMSVPRNFDTAFITGGVARWMLRRAHRLTEEVAAGTRVDTVYLPVGDREMRETEHELVGDYAGGHDGRMPTERDFAAVYLADLLREAGVRVEMFDVDTSIGDDLMAQFAREVSDRGTTLAVANSPSAIQTAGQFRMAARAAQSDYDKTGEQLFVTADGTRVAREGQGPATHQNPFTALGQIARNALFLHRNAE